MNLHAMKNLAFGCGIAAIYTTSPAFAGEEGVTFHKSVEAIFQQRCQECHRPNQIAPMSLLTYEEARPWAKSIQKQVLSRAMPPWHADSQSGPFSNDMSLTNDEIELIAEWVTQGAPRGNPDDAPDPIAWPDTEWTLGKPDAVFLPAGPITVPVTEQDEDLYLCVCLESDLEEDTWVEAFEYRVPNKKIVHHIVAFVDTTGMARKRDAATPEPGYPCGMGQDEAAQATGGVDSMLGGWGPGVPPNISHPGTAKLLKEGSTIVLQMHYYNQTGEPQIDRSGVGIHIAKNPVQARSRVMAIIAPPYNYMIKAGDANAVHNGKFRIPNDIYVYSMAAHMHYLGRSMTMSAEYPNGNIETLISIPRYNFNWQRSYRLETPQFLPKGTIVHMESVHDNTSNNPLNPSNPPVDVKWGESTNEEMSIGFLGYWRADEHKL